MLPLHGVEKLPRAIEPCPQYENAGMQYIKPHLNTESSFIREGINNPPLPPPGIKTHPYPPRYPYTYLH